MDKEHNANFYSLQNVEQTLDSLKDFQDGEELYYHIGSLRYLYDKNSNLNKGIDKILTKYEETIKAYDEWFKPNSKINQLVCNKDEANCYREFIQDLKKLKGE